MVKTEPKSELRFILNQEVIRFRNRLIVAILLWIPVVIFAWVLPYASP